jgi:hypothetical protein
MPAAVREIIDDNRAALASGALLQPLLVAARLGASASGTVGNRYGDVYVFRVTTFARRV